MKKIFEKTLALQDLNVLCEKISELLQNGVKIFLLRGDLGAGKTTLMARFLAERGEKLPVNSPTFSLMQNYGEIFHYDLYFHGAADFVAHGFLENLGSGAHFIEWGGADLAEILASLGYNFAVITILREDAAAKYEVFCE